MGHLGLQTWSPSPRVYLSVRDLRKYLRASPTASVTISEGQKFVLGLSVSVHFPGKYVWGSHHWARELISDRWKDFTSSVDAAFRHNNDSVFLIKVLLGQGQGWARKFWNRQERLSPKWPWHGALTNRFQVSSHCAFLSHKGVCA